MHNLNEQLFFYINAFAGRFGMLDGFFVFVTRYFVPVLMGLAAVWFFIILPKKALTVRSKANKYIDGVLFVLSLILVSITVRYIKTTVGFPRPSQILDGVNSLSTFGDYDSFPSMHSALAFAVAAFVYHYSRLAGTMVFVLAIIVAISRIFVGVHFPVDVLVGAIIGSLISWGIIRIFKYDTL